MSYRGIKRVLGESSLERKIQALFAACLLILISGSFFWVNQITEDLIRRNTLDQASALTFDFLLRTHLENMRSLYDNMENKQQATSSVYAILAAEPTSVPYQADVIALDAGPRRDQMKAKIATDPAEIRRLRELLTATEKLQQQQYEIEAAKAFSGEAFAEQLAAVKAAPFVPEDAGVKGEVAYITSKKYYYYAPLIFKSQALCLFCHRPVPEAPGSNPRLAQIENLLARPETTPEQTRELTLEKNELAPLLFLRITMDNAITQSAITKNRAILISVAIVTAVLSVGMLWIIVRYVIVKPLAHLRDVTEEVRHGRMDVRAELNTGDEFEELSRSFNLMLRYMLDTQNALREANNGLDRKVDEQAQLNLKLFEMNQIKSEFLTNMSHELRTPLNSIIGFSELLEHASGLDEKQTRYASNICNSGRLLLDLINDILDLAKLEAGKMEVRPTEFSIGQLVSGLCDMVRQLADSKNLKLEFSVDPNLPPVVQDKVKVQQILTNLLSNAIKFTPEGGRITVTVQRLPSQTPRLIIQVQDTGVGIAPADQQIVFEKFRQGPSAIGNDSLTREVSGTGLGLSIVKELCVLLGGKIELSSEIGQGSLFQVSLPWEYRHSAKVNSELSEEISEIIKQPRVDFARANQTPVPPPVEAD